MAEIGGKWSAAQTRAQFGAIARLRLQIFRNTLRRKGGKGDLVATIIMVPIFLAVIIGPTVVAGFAAWYFVHNNHMPMLAVVLWVLFALTQLVSIQLGQPGTVFDPTQLIRFPVNFRGYALIRVFFGLVSPANFVVTLASFAVALGVTVADPDLGLAAFVAMIAFVVANIFFTRMVFSWVDRWLATRRAREVFTGLILFFSLGIQWLNFTFNPGFQHGHHGHAVNAARVTMAQNLYAHAKPVLGLLPPGLVTNGLVAVRASHVWAYVANVVGILAFAGVFFAVFAVRLQKEFRGENLSEVANAVAKTPAKKAGAVPVAVAASKDARFSAPSTVAAVFGKEFLATRRNTGVFFAIVAPLFFVVLIIAKLSSQSPLWILFPAAVAYTMMGISPLAYNSLGLEGAGVQFYFLAPVRWSEVFLAKNLVNILLGVIEFVAVFVTVTVSAGAPSPMMTLSVFLWAVFVLSLNMAIGNRRSVTAPKKIDPAKAANKQAGPLSSLLAIGVLLVAGAMGAGVMLAARFLDMPWILPPSMLVLAVVGVVVYRKSLAAMDGVVARHRDTLIEVLCKGQA